MNREKFYATAQYKRLRNELTKQKFILRNLDKDNKDAIASCENKIKELQKLMKI